MFDCWWVGAAKHRTVLWTGPTTQHYSPKRIDSARSKNCFRDDYQLVLILMSSELVSLLWDTLEHLAKSNLLGL